MFFWQIFLLQRPGSTLKKLKRPPHKHSTPKQTLEHYFMVCSVVPTRHHKVSPFRDKTSQKTSLLKKLSQKFKHVTRQGVRNRRREDGKVLLTTASQCSKEAAHNIPRTKLGLLQPGKLAA